jgi:hypothetical protein
MYKWSEYYSNFPPALLFCAKYHVSWIVKWHYQIKDKILVKSYTVKWFDKYNKDRIITFVYDEFLVKPMQELEDKPSVRNYEGGKGAPKVGMPFHLLQISVSEECNSQAFIKGVML